MGTLVADPLWLIVQAFQHHRRRMTGGGGTYAPMTS